MSSYELGLAIDAAERMSEIKSPIVLRGEDRATMRISRGASTWTVNSPGASAVCRDSGCVAALIEAFDDTYGIVEIIYPRLWGDW